MNQAEGRHVTTQNLRRRSNPQKGWGPERGFKKKNRKGGLDHLPIPAIGSNVQRRKKTGVRIKGKWEKNHGRNKTTDY